jgi:hypothetical protein
VLFLLPILGCSLVDCAPHDGSISVSSIIDNKVLSTTYSFWGAVFLTALTHFQIECKKGLKVILAIVGSKLLAVPLFLPFGSVDTDSYHYFFAVAGFAVEWLYIACVFFDIKSAPKPPPGARFVLWTAFPLATSAVIIAGLTVMGSANVGYKRVGIILAEYLFASSLLVVTKASNYYKLY